ncbi:MAG: peptide/nickel transport system permease protein [Thermomicrobiales bacterium]|nr:peptide/nickel transport system permease protein [Thermomicrobiales bacterium]
MGRYILRRVVITIPTLVLLSFIIFAIVRVIPGDPVGVLLEKNQDPVLAAELRRHYGLDQPLPVQYGRWMRDVLGGSFGRSMINGVPVSDLLAQRFPRSLWLMGGGVGVALLIAVPVGLLAAARQNSWFDILATGLVALLMSIPTFWIGILYILLFAVQLHWLPATGFSDPFVDPWQFLKHMWLPWLTLGGTLAALTARIFRASLIEALASDFTRTAAAKGLSSRRVILAHACRNAAIPTVTVLGMEMGYLIGGAVVTERVFAYPGMGLFLVDAIFARDYPVIQAGLLVFATAFVLMNLLTDIVIAVIDPRIRLG